MSAKVLVEPIAPHRRGADHSHGLIGLFFYLITELCLPWLHPEAVGPSEAIALALDAHENRAGGMFVRLGVLPGFVLCDLHVEVSAGHVWLDAPIVKRAAVIWRQLASENVGDNIGAAHSETAHRIGIDIFHRFEIVI